MELLAPAGSPEALQAAVQAGADAVYLGCGPLNARQNAKNFPPEALPEAVAYCHLRGVKVYLTMNTLLTDRELAQAAQLGAQASAAGVDAILVQDLGVAKLLREHCPDLPLHGSTQMTVCTLDGVQACADLGLERVVLARELPGEAIRFLCQHSPIELEVFAHGALCMCYSGQCALSAMVGGRSGNRGLCAQPCRLPYQSAGGGKGHPLSLKDLSLVDALGELEDMGVACVKIEGRMKRPEYVFLVTEVYAAALRERRTATQAERQRLAAAFSRGFTDGYYRDQVGPAMLGTRPEGQREPEALFTQARQTYQKEPRRVPVSLSGQLRDKPLTVAVTDRQGHQVAALGDVPEAARTRAITPEQLETQLRKTGGTVYVPDQVTVQVEPGLSVPLSAVNALRRQALDALDQARTAVPPRRTLPVTLPGKGTPSARAPQMALSFRYWKQLSEEILAEKPALVYLPSQEMARHQRDLKALISRHPSTRFAVVFPRIFWDRELPQLRRELSAAQAAGVDCALLHHIGQLPLAAEFGFAPRGDFDLGLLNSFTARELARLGFVSATGSFEARWEQLRDLEKPLEFEVLAYGQLPLMITQQDLVGNQGGQEALDLRDRKGADFPMERAWGGRSELFNGKRLWLADRLADLTALGADWLRLHFLREEAGQCAAVLAAYREGAAPPEDFTRGLYYRGVQ